MKIFKWIYYPVLLILIVAFVALGFVGVTSSDKSVSFDAATRAEVDNHIKAVTDLGSHNANYDNNLKSVSDYIRSSVREDQIIQYRPTSYPDSEEGLNTASYALTSENGKTVPRPSVVTQSAVILASTAEKMNTLEDGTYYVNRTVNNLIVAIPGSDTAAKYADPENEQLSYGDVIMFTARYDSSTLNDGAANAAVVANMIEVINAAVNRETKYKNDLLFVFTSGGEEGALGAYAFKYQFKGFDDICSRVNWRLISTRWAARAHSSCPKQLPTARLSFPLTRTSAESLIPVLFILPFSPPKTRLRTSIFTTTSPLTISSRLTTKIPVPLSTRQITSTRAS